MSVIHGSGKPRFEIATPTVLTDTVASSTATSVVLTTTADLDTLNTTHVLLNRLVETVNTTSGVTFGRVTNWDQSSKTLNVESWNNGNPTAGQAVVIKSFRIDLPFCQSLIESWSPDFITKKLFSGNISINKRGFYYSAILDYSQWMDGDLVEYLRPLYRNDWKEFMFYPRLDNLNVSYVVDISPETEFSIRQTRGHKAHKLVQIKLIGTRRLADINLLVPTGTGYGTGYGTDGYGSQL
jgi:hypothetical protein